MRVPAAAVPGETELGEAAVQIDRIGGDRLATFAADHDDLVVRPVPIGELVDAELVVVSVEEGTERTVAGEGPERADEHEDALGHEQPGGSLGEGLFLATASAQLVVEGWVDVGEPEALAADLDAQKAGRSEDVAAGQVRPRDCGPAGIELDGVDVLRLDAECGGDLLDGPTLAGTGVEDGNGAAERLVGIGRLEVEVFDEFGDGFRCRRVPAEFALGSESHGGFSGWVEFQNGDDLGRWVPAR